MMMANGGTNYGWPCDGDDGVDLAADDDSMSMDIESLMSILDERPPDDYSQNGLADPSLSIAPCNEPASHVGVNDPQTHDDHSEASASRTVCSSGSSDSGRQRVNYGFTKVEPLPDVSSRHFSSRSLADWACPFPSDDNSNTANTIVYPDFSSSSHYDTRETNFERANRGGSFRISDSNGNDDQLMDKYGITDGIYCNSDTPDNVDASFVDISEYPNILYDQDDEFSMPFSMNLNELSYPGTSRLIYNNNGMLFNDKNTSEQHLMPNASSNSARNYETIRPSSESSSDTHAKWSTSASMLPNKIEKSFGVTNQVFAEKGFVQSFSGVVNSFSSKDHVIKGEQETKRPHQFIDIIDGSRLNDSSIKKQQIYTKEERESKFDAFTSKFVANSKVSHITCIEDDEPDVIIIEDMSDPARKKQPPVDGKSLIIAQRSSLGAPAPPTHMGYNNARVKTNDERFIYRVALQDLSPPKSEASAPDGSLAVSLLRHQRIALSWMVQKETKSMHCCGGILADDQGLGKTISTIALILKERSPSSSVCKTEMKKIETKTYNLDDDGGAVTELDESSQKVDSTQTNSRLAAGTLVVCPTSVLRQWNDELHNKVSTKANLSVLIYHGANRTKDPSELAKFDVVLTTYAIVSMEVPKQAFVNEDEDETRKRHELIPVSSGKKRKYPPSSSKSSKKDNDLESLARPLAKVRWFRVVLDEAQSIKNYRTGVARSCWGLKAKRRWCLSGTPIQNAIDDLYSYFRFLRYDPYCVYKSFCSGIKAPIQRNPGNGYKKLQAVLKTIMLRRTKGTLLDGEPIISLPPKTINLKKVDFTAEERDFYCRLEADSRAQFAEYAAAGTVKQNYVNILLMLLRLRQACDHPLLVRGCSSGSEWKSSIEKAKKLPIEIRSRLLNCLEASLAICSICSDVPEDAVVTTCEHVFCNQCILEHLSSDDSQCPSSKCKVILSNSSVFTKSTLRLSLDNNNAPDSLCSSKPEILEPCSSSGSVNSSNIEAAEALDSSKIKAAVEVLHSIAKPRGISVNSNDLSGVFENDSNEQKLVVREKAIVFSQWTRMLDLFEACLKDSSIGYRRLDGTMSVVARDKAVKDFNTLPEVTVMIMSLKAASLGLNMVAACHVLLLDLWWNPTTEDQAIDRAHRIGQTRPVSVLRLTVKDTVEDRILALQQKKREMVSSAFGEDETGSGQTRLTVDDLKYLFQA